MHTQPALFNKSSNFGFRVLTATGEELQAVDGIGESIAERIKWAVREEIQSYGVIDEFPI